MVKKKLYVMFMIDIEGFAQTVAADCWTNYFFQSRNIRTKNLICTVAHRNDTISKLCKS